MSHLDEGLLHALLDGEIPSDELAPIQAHLASCPDCRARLEQERQLLADADGLVEALELPAETAVRGATRRPRPRWGPRLAWAASLLGAVGLGYVARGSGPPPGAPAAVTAMESRSDSSVLGDVRPPAEPPGPPAAPPAASAARPEPVAATGTLTSRAATRTPARKLAAKASAERLEEPVVTGRAAADSVAGVREERVASPAVALDRAALSRAAAAPALGRVPSSAGGFAQLNAAAPPQLAPPEPIGLPDAVRRLGGSLRLVDGLVPLRLEAQGQVIRVVYALAQGELVLSQQLIDGRVSVQLIAPQGFPADSLEKLRARVRE